MAVDMVAKIDDKYNDDPNCFWSASNWYLSSLLAGFVGQTATLDCLNVLAVKLKTCTACMQYNQHEYLSIIKYVKDHSLSYKPLHVP